MIAEHINPFLTSLANTMQTMLGCSLQRGKLMLKSDHVTMHDYSGVIGLTGKAVGTVVVSLSKEMAIKANLSCCWRVKGSCVQSNRSGLEVSERNGDQGHL